MRRPANKLRCAARLASLAALALLVAACAGTRGGPGPGSASGGGGYYMDDGPGNGEPADIASIADAVPSDEPVRAANSRPYEVFGQRYVPMRARTPYRESGIASWYGRKFHGNATASGERYDMYAMTAAHRTLPLPSYVRVTNLSNQRSVVVRVNDRGPFIKNRLIDLSWTAAKKLDFIDNGHARVLVELVLPGEGPAVQGAPLATAPSPSPSVASIAPAPAPPAVELPATPISPRADAASQVSQPPRVPPGFVLVDAEPAGTALPASQPGGFVRVDDEARPGAVYLQLGAYQSRDSATAAASDLGRQLAWLDDSISLYLDNGQYKVHAGPWGDAERAAEAAARIRAETRIEPFVVRRGTAR